MNPIIITIIVLSSLLLIFLLLLLILNKLTSALFINRNEGDMRFKFYSLRDYPNLKKENISINSSYNARLNGGIFYYPSDSYKGVILFYHGLLSGYLNYFNLIEYFCKHNYKVVAFDNLGNYSSEGTSVKGMPVIDKDNKRMLEFVKTCPSLKGLNIYVMGHSWGGHAALTSLIHDDIAIKKAVAFSPYNSNIDCMYSFAPVIKIFSPILHALNLFKFGHESTYKVTDALKYTSADVLIFCGGNDQIVKEKYSYLKYKKVIENNSLDNVTIKYYPHRDHFINLSEAAADYFTKNVSFPRSAPIDFKNLDYKKLYELDEDTLKQVLDFLN